MLKRGLTKRSRSERGPMGPHVGARLMVRVEDTWSQGAKLDGVWACPCLILGRIHVNWGAAAARGMLLAQIVLLLPKTWLK